LNIAKKNFAPRTLKETTPNKQWGNYYKDYKNIKVGVCERITKSSHCPTSQETDLLRRTGGKSSKKWKAFVHFVEVYGAIA